MREAIWSTKDLIKYKKWTNKKNYKKHLYLILHRNIM
jgi:hypothetical protein